MNCIDDMPRNWTKYSPKYGTQRTFLISTSRARGSARFRYFELGYRVDPLNMSFVISYDADYKVLISQEGKKVTRGQSTGLGAE